MNRILINDTLHDITVEMVAEEFCKLGSDQMAEFFSVVAAKTSKWQSPFCFQLAWVTDDPALDYAGRELMHEIGQYAYPPEQSK